jgi:prepilin-type processing-associated H-X9-DG protein
MALRGCLRPWTVGFLVSCSVLSGWAGGIAADALTVADFAFMPGADEGFVEAYRVFLKAKAGDQGDGAAVPTYGQAARAFLTVGAASSHLRMQLRCAWFGAFCRFLDMDFPGAQEAARTVPAYAEQLSPQETALLREILGQVNDGRIDGPGALIQHLQPAGAGEHTPSLEEDVAGQLTAILERTAQVREERQKLTTSALRTRLSDPGADRDQVQTLAVLACLFRGLSVNVSENRAKVSQAVCAANLRRLGVLIHLYAQDNEGYLPEAYDGARRQVWQFGVLPYAGDASWAERGAVWRCPSCAPGAYSYGINQNVAIRSQSFPAQGSRERIRTPGETVLLADSVHYLPGEYPQKPNYGGAAYKIDASKEHLGTGTIDWDRHSGGANVLFVDGHVEWRSPRMGLDWTGR